MRFALLVLLASSHFLDIPRAIAREGCRNTAPQSAGATVIRSGGPRATDVKRLVANDEAMRRAIESRLVRPTRVERERR